MDRLQIREIDDRVAVGVAASEPIGLHFDSTQVDGCAIGKRDGRLARLLEAQEVLADVLVRDDVDSECPADVGVSASVVAVMVAVQQVLHRQRAHHLHLLQHLGRLIGEFVVDEDQTFRRHPHRHVSGFVDQAVSGLTGFAADHARQGRTPDDVEAFLDLSPVHRRLLEDFHILSFRGNCCVTTVSARIPKTAAKVMARVVRMHAILVDSIRRGLYLPQNSLPAVSVKVVVAVVMRSQRRGCSAPG